MVTSPVALERLVVALLVGVLIGLDRERAEARKAHLLFAGVRTFPLIALAGAIPMLVLDAVGPLLLVGSLLAVVGVALVSYVRTSATGDLGATTEIAAVVTFLLGVVAGAGQLVVAGAAGVGVAVLLAAKPSLERFSRALTGEELAAALELAVISVIILPLLPNRGYGPWQVLNPFEIWLVVVLVSALSFAGFVATRLVGERRGLALAGAVGAVVSSTAVTMAMAARSRTDQGLAAAAAAATVWASTVMCLRVAVLAGIVNLGILPRLVPVVAIMALGGAVAAWLLGRKTAAPDAGPSGAILSNPFSLTAALSFAVVYALVRLVAHAAQEHFGASGLYVAAAFSALTDVDAVTIAFTRLGPDASGWQVPAAAVTIAVVTNTLVKLGIALVAGARRFRLYVTLALGVIAMLGALAGVVVFARF
jgi:uncharacterized membrane protein (DUF4010 family)